MADAVNESGNRAGQSVALFPGQGIDARAILDRLAPGAPLLTNANEILGYDLRKRVQAAARRNGGSLPTSVAQPALFVASLVSFHTTVEDGRTFDWLAGHSVGEYAALAAGDAFSPEQGLYAVSVRAAATEEAARTEPGGMVAVIGLEAPTVEEIAREAGVFVANDNCPGQIVLSGLERDLAHAAGLVRAAGGRAVLLEVSGAFHSPAMAPATSAVAAALDDIDVKAPRVPVVSNVTARPYESADEIRRLLVAQLTEPVLFRAALEWLWERGVRRYEDVGPGRVVGGLARRTFDALEGSEVVLRG